MENRKSTPILILISIILCIVSVFAIKAGLDKQKKNKDVPVQNEKNYFILKEGDKQGVVDKYGKKIVEPKYDKIIMPNYSYPLFFGYIGDKQIILDDKSEFVFSKRGKKKQDVSPIYEDIEGYKVIRPYIKYKLNDKYGIMNLNGLELTKAIYDEIRPMPEDNEAYIVKINGKEGIVNGKGVEILKADNIGVYSMNIDSLNIKTVKKGYIFVKESENKKTHKGYITSDGNMLLEAKYDDIYKVQIDSKDIYLIAKKDQKVGVFKNQEKIIDINNNDIKYSSSFFLAQKDDQYILYSLNGNKLKDSNKEIQIKNNYAVIQHEDKDQVIDEKGQEIFESEKPVYNIFDFNNKKYVILYENNEYTINEIKDKNVLENVMGENESYKSIHHLYEDIITLQNKNNKYIAIKLNDRKQTKHEFNYITLYSNTKMLMGYNDNENILYGKNLEPIENTKNIRQLNRKDIEEVYLYLEINDELKVLSEDGTLKDLKEVLKDNILPFKASGKYGYKDRNGKIIVEPIYDHVGLFNEYGFAAVKKGGKWGVLDKEAKVTLEPKIEDKTIADIYGENDPIFIDKYISSIGLVNTVYNLENLPSLDRFKEDIKQVSLMNK